MLTVSLISFSQRFGAGERGYRLLAIADVVVAASRFKVARLLIHPEAEIGGKDIVIGTR